jgi:hypothetical protein
MVEFEVNKHKKKRGKLGRKPRQQNLRVRVKKNSGTVPEFMATSRFLSMSRFEVRKIPDWS